ncbi:YgcG family protein [uncultured Cytophaga sp.]|uniref:TPM domain-containing protein n=1 Tax=uncultured Cytophaga sp. TaxID=160238 RepID=UPI0026311655|nr:TPM domain-containing protein [uncultured Cytophaga sp.]
MKSRFLFLFILLFSFKVSAQSNDFPPKPSPARFVNDFAGLLSATEANELEQKVKRFNDSTSIEIAIVIISNLGDYDISDYAFQLGELWGIGKKSKNNGVLLLIAKENRKAFIATGYGMGGVLPDMRCKLIIESELVPQFKRSNYFNGINFTIDAIIRYSENEYAADPKGNKSSPVPNLFIMIFVLIIIVSFFNYINRDKKGNNKSRSKGGRFGPIIGGGLGGYSSDSSDSDSSGDSSGGGGFGGGGFGGGGSGGSW